LNKLALLAIAGAALFAASGAASAQIYTGPGYSIQIEPRYERDYDRPRYRRDYDDDDRRYYRRSGNGCPRNYTVQDGVCKPYRGY
jgi:hypothetical protein